MLHSLESALKRVKGTAFIMPVCVWVSECVCGIYMGACVYVCMCQCPCTCGCECQCTDLVTTFSYLYTNSQFCAMSKVLVGEFISQLNIFMNFTFLWLCVKVLFVSNIPELLPGIPMGMYCARATSCDMWNFSIECSPGFVPILSVCWFCATENCRLVVRYDVENWKGVIVGTSGNN